MADNIIQTRIQLKYDTFGRWQEHNPLLKKGELAIATTAPFINEENPDVESGQHPVLFKVGPGNFNSLPWASALAADVYGWAKKNENDFVKDFLTLKMTDGTTIQTKLDDVFATNTELTNAINGLRAEIPTQLGVMSVTKKDGTAIEVDNTNAANPKVGFKIDATQGNHVTVTQSNNGLKVQVDTGVHAVSLASGTNNGTVKLTVDGTATDNIAVKGLQDAAYTTVATLNATAKGYADDAEAAAKGEATAVKTGVENGTIKAKDAEHADAAGQVDKALTIKVGGKTKTYNGSAEVEADVDSAITAAVNAKHIPEYSIVKDATSDYAATYHLTKDGTNIGTAINIPKDMVVESGEVKTLEAGTGGAAGTYIVLTLSNATNDKLYINVGDLIEYVTSGSTANDAIVISIDDDHKVTAAITDGKITKAKLETSVQTTLTNADTAYGWGNHASQGYLKSGDIANKVDKVSGTQNNFVAFGANGAIKDSGKKAGDFATSAQGTKADNALPANGWETYGTTLERVDSGYSIKLDPQWIEVGDSNRGIYMDESGVKVYGDKNEPYSNTTYADGQIERYDGIVISLPGEDGILALTKNVKAKRATALNDTYANGQIVVAVDQDVDGNITSEKKDVAQALSDSSNIQYLVFDCGSATDVI